MKKILNAANAFFRESTGAKDEITYEQDTLSCYAFILLKDSVGNYNISFNDDLPTSTLILIAIKMIPFFVNALAAPVQVISSHCPYYDEDGDLLGNMMEERYTKVITPDR